MNQQDAERTVRNLVETYLTLEDAILKPVDLTEGSQAASLVIKQLVLIELLAVTAAATANAAEGGNIQDVIVGIIERGVPLAQRLLEEARLVATPDWARHVREVQH